jgi:excinuclease ABC subunit A
MGTDSIIIKGAKVHNLKSINVTIPRNSFTVITGLSGSGKSSLAFDTLYAEGQRRYVESLSTYARQFLGQMDKPEVDSITGLSPAIAIEQKSTTHNPRSTVGTITEIYDYLRLLYARIGQSYCHQCGSKINAITIDQITDHIMAFENQSKIIILSPLVRQKKGSHAQLITSIKKQGFARIRVDQIIYPVESVPDLDKKIPHTIEAVIDRIIIKDKIQKRLADSLELALSFSEGSVIVHDLTSQTDFFFKETASCDICHISYPEFEPSSFSFNSPQGACPACDGLGTTMDFDPDLIVPDPSLSLRQGAVLPWVKRDSVQFMEFLDALVTHYNQDIYTPFKDLSKAFQNVLFYGSGKEKIRFYVEKADKKIHFHQPFDGIIPGLKKHFIQKKSKSFRENAKQYMSTQPCPTCKGSRLNPSSSSVKIQNRSIWQLTCMSIEHLHGWLSCLDFDAPHKTIAYPILTELIQRLEFLQNVGLEYLTLDRPASTLSGGETQRIRLATQIGSKLTGVIYVLDEPSIGLHQRDNARLLTTLMNLQQLGNTVLVVEHDHDTIQACDYIIDIGPAAGVNGGQLIFSGPPEDIIYCDTSLTGQYLSGKKKIPIPSKRRTGSGKSITITHASSNNLKHINVDFPLGTFTCVTGVSGSGKSTLVINTLYRILTNHIYLSRKKAGAHGQVIGLEHIDKVVHIDQSPIGRSPRSNPVTYTQTFQAIRELFSATKAAKAKGYKPGRFSFNVKGGRCEACSGDGIKKIEMHFLPDVYVACDVCKGKRYNRETLDILYKGKNIDQVLNMTINQAYRFFENISAIRLKLHTLIDVGVGYIKLGQPAPTLSGGEAQRIKLARELSKKQTGRTIYIMDEPTTGLHSHDIDKLLQVLNQLVDNHNTVVVIEHHLDVIKSADHVIDLGPEGGDKGGKIICTGTPEQVAENHHSYTGFYLNKILS